MKSTEWRIRPGLLINEDEIVRALKESGYYRSAIPRSKEPVAQKSATTQRKHKRSPWPPKRVLRYMDRDTFQRFISDRERTAWDLLKRNDGTVVN
jgi:type IV secretory pathway ATPase VirB11/archaellum biosynthesis ATPase